MSVHLTRAQLEQLLADDLRVPAALRVHAGSCDRCTVRRLALERARARYMSLHPAPEFARVVVERVNGRLIAGPAPDGTMNTQQVVALLRGAGGGRAVVQELLDRCADWESRA